MARMTYRRLTLWVLAVGLLLMCVEQGCKRRTGQEPGPWVAVPTATPTPQSLPSTSPDATQGAQSPGNVAQSGTTSLNGGGAQAGPATGSGAARGEAAGAPPKRASDSSIAEPPPPPPPPPRVYTLPAGSRLSVYTTNTITTKTAKPGDIFSSTLANPIVDRDWVIAKRGAPVEGVVISSDPGGRVKGVASLTVAIKHLTLADGRRVTLLTDEYTKKAPTTRKKDAAKIGIGAGVGALIGGIAGGKKGALIGGGAGGGAGTAYVLATRGDPAVIPAESHLTFRLNSPVKVTQRNP